MLSVLLVDEVVVPTLEAVVMVGVDEHMVAWWKSFRLLLLLLLGMCFVVVCVCESNACECWMIWLSWKFERGQALSYL